MNQYMTALLLICATLMGQGQAAQLHVNLLDVRIRQELNQQRAVEPLLRAQLRMLASVDLFSLIKAAGQAILPSENCNGRPMQAVFPGTQLRSPLQKLQARLLPQPRSP